MCGIEGNVLSKLTVFFFSLREFNPSSVTQEFAALRRGRGPSAPRTLERWGERLFKLFECDCGSRGATEAMPSGDADTAAAAMASHADVVSSELTLPIYAEESTRGDALALAALRMEIDGPKNYVSMWGKGDVGAKAHPEARIGAGVPIRSGGIGAAHAGNVESMPGHSLPDTIATRKSMW